MEREFEIKISLRYSIHRLIRENRSQNRDHIYIKQIERFNFVGENYIIT